MQDTKLFETILGITAPWHVGRVELKTDEQRVDLWLEHDPTRWPCPDCGDRAGGLRSCGGTDVAALNTCQFQTHLHAEIPRAAAPVRRMGSNRYACHGRSRGVASRC